MSRPPGLESWAKRGKRLAAMLAATQHGWAPYTYYHTARPLQDHTTPLHFTHSRRRLLCSTLEGRNLVEMSSKRACWMRFPPTVTCQVSSRRHPHRSPPRSQRQTHAACMCKHHGVQRMLLRGVSSSTPHVNCADKRFELQVGHPIPIKALHEPFVPLPHPT